MVRAAPKLACSLLISVFTFNFMQCVGHLEDHSDLTEQLALHAIAVTTLLLKQPACNAPISSVQCVGHLEDHSDLTEQQVLAALAEHEREVAPVLRYYKASLVSKRWLRCGAHVGCAEEHKREVAPVLRYYKASLVCKRLLWLRYLQFDYVSGTRVRWRLCCGTTRRAMTTVGRCSVFLAEH